MVATDCLAYAQAHTHAHTLADKGTASDSDVSVGERLVDAGDVSYADAVAIEVAMPILGGITSSAG